MNGSRQTSKPKWGDADWWTSRRFLLLLALALFAVFPKVTLGLNTLFYRDFGALGYPCATFHRESLLHGELPLWNPYSHCGVPFLAQMGGWYLPSWVCLFLPFPWALNFFVLVHLAFGGLGMYWLARRWQVTPFPATFAGFAYVFNGVMLSSMIWPNYIASLGWLPWVVGCVMATWRSGGRWVVLAAMASAMQVLTATPELTLLTWFFLGLIWLGEIFSGSSRVWLSGARMVAVVALASGLVMVQMLPFFDLMANSQRTANSAEAAMWAMPGWGWANLLVPLFHCYEGPQGTWFQTGQEFLQSYYLGAGVLALAIIGSGWQRQRALTLGMILFCWIMALGTDGHLYDFLRKIFPVVGIARFPVKFAILPAFLLPLLAAAGMEKLLATEDKSPRRIFLLIVAGFLALIGALVWFLRAYPFPNDTWSGTAMSALGRGMILLALAAGVLFLRQTQSRSARCAAQIFLLVLVPLDAFTHSPRLVPTLIAEVQSPGIWEADGRPALPLGAGRIMISSAADAQLTAVSVPDFRTDYIGKRVTEWYNLNLLDKLPKVNGAFTLRPARFDAMERYLYFTPNVHYGAGLLNFLAVAWITSPTNLLEWSARTNFLPVITAGPMPRFAADTPTWRGITAKDFDPRAVVYLPEAARAIVTISNQTDCVVSNTHFSNNQITADISAQTPSLVVLSQANYHLWQATVDGQPTPILQANLAFQALQVPAGKHQIKLVYHDPNLIRGAIISLLTLVVCGGIWRWSRAVTV